MRLKSRNRNGTRMVLQTKFEKSSVANISIRTKAYGAPEEIRTPDPQIRSLVLYPAELRALLPSPGNQATEPRDSYRLAVSLARVAGIIADATGTAWFAQASV